MRIATALTVLFLSLTPLTARAGFALEASVGQGLQLVPSVEADPTNIMLAPGWSFADWVRLEVGVATAFGYGDDDEAFDLEVRPMFVLDPPFVPVYLRAIVAGSKLLSDESDPLWAYGGALGVGGSIGPVGLFGEVGALTGFTVNYWVLEGRLGIYFIF